MEERPYRLPVKIQDCTCPEDFVQHNCTCYGLFKEVNGTWATANASCIRKGAQLVSIADEEEITNLKHFLRSEWWETAQPRSYEKGEWFFIGIYDQVRS